MCDGSHELQKHSGIPNEVLRAIQWYTDLPSGPREAWQPFHAGFPVSDHYVVRYTRPAPCGGTCGHGFDHSHRRRHGHLSAQPAAFA